MLFVLFITDILLIYRIKARFRLLLFRLKQIFIWILLLIKRQQSTFSIQGCTEVKIIYRGFGSLHNFGLMSLHSIFISRVVVVLIKVHHLLFLNVILRLANHISRLTLTLLDLIIVKEHLLIVIYIFLPLAFSRFLSTSTDSSIIHCTHWLNWHRIHLFVLVLHDVLLARFVIVIKHVHGRYGLVWVVLIQSIHYLLLLLFLNFSLSFQFSLDSLDFAQSLFLLIIGLNSFIIQSLNLFPENSLLTTHLIPQFAYLFPEIVLKL